MEASVDAAVLRGTDADSGKGGSIESVATATDPETPIDSHDDAPSDDTEDRVGDTSTDDVFEDTDTASLEYDDECSTFSETTSITSSLAGIPNITNKGNEQLTISSANVTGFRSSKPQSSLLAGESPEYVFIVEVEWSDGRHNVVKRTYGDFCSFHCYLLDEFARLAESSSASEGMRMNLYLPVHSDGSNCDLMEAEKRELQLNKYVQDLVKLPHQLSASPTVLTFFESRNSDPKPYAEQQAQMNMTTFNNSTNHYVICWIDS